MGGTLLTRTYSGRLLRLVFSADPRSAVPLSQHEPRPAVLILLLVLGLSSSTSGLLATEVVALAPSNPAEANHLLSVESVPSVYTSLFPLALALLGGAFGLYLPSPPSHLRITFFSLSFNQAIWELSFPRLLVRSAVYVTRTSSKTLDTGFWETLGPHGVTSLLFPSLAPSTTPPLQIISFTLVTTLAKESCTTARDLISPVACYKPVSVGRPGPEGYTHNNPPCIKRLFKRESGHRVLP